MEPAISFTEDEAFEARHDTIYVEGLEGVGIKTWGGYQVTACKDILLETGEPAYYYSFLRHHNLFCNTTTI